MRLTLALSSLDAEQQDGLYPVTAISAGTAHGLNFSAQVIEESLLLWAGVPVYVDHAGLNDVGRPGGRSIRDLAGVFLGARFEPTAQAIKGHIRFLESAQWLTALVDEVMSLKAAGEPAPALGLSADIFLERTRDREVKCITRVCSLDVVMNPARGGEFDATQLANMIKSYQEAFPVTKPIIEEQDDTIVERHTLTNPAGDNKASAQAERSSAPVPVVPGKKIETPGTPLHAALLDARLQAAQLPPTLERTIRAQFGQVSYMLPDLDAALADAQAIVREIAPQPVIRGLGHSITQMQAPEDRVQLAFDRLMGLKIPEAYADTPRLTGIREFYLLLSGDHDLHGSWNPDRALLANMTTSSMTSIVKNALNKVLLAAYDMVPQWWAGTVWEEDFPTMNDVTWITTGGFADLPTVAEGAAYVEQASPTDIEETSAFLKKGGYAALTMEMIDRDDVGALRAIPRKMGIAAARTLASGISAIYTQASGLGPTLGQDSTALFDAGHGNLGSTALSLSSWDACIVAMFEQAEPVSSKAMGLRPKYLLIPIELEKTALEIMRSKLLITGENATYPDANVRQASAGVVVVPDWTDANNWAAVADPMMAPGICVGYRFGRAPELFVSDSPLMGSMFTNDVMRIKTRFVYTIGIGEYRALYKANVT